MTLPNFKTYFLGGSAVKNLSAMQKMQVQSLGWEEPLEEEMENPMGRERGARQVKVHGVAKESDTT